MSAQPIHEEPDPLDPAGILQDLPQRWHRLFVAEYEAAVLVARRVDGYQHLHDVLKLWRLLVGVYSDPGFDDRVRARGEAGPIIPADISDEYGRLQQRIAVYRMSHAREALIANTRDTLHRLTSA